MLKSAEANLYTSRCILYTESIQICFRTHYWNFLHHTFFMNTFLWMLPKNSVNFLCFTSGKEIIISSSDEIGMFLTIGNIDARRKLLIWHFPPSQIIVTSWYWSSWDNSRTSLKQLVIEMYFTASWTLPSIFKWKVSEMHRIHNTTKSIQKFVLPIINTAN